MKSDDLRGVAVLFDCLHAHAGGFRALTHVGHDLQPLECGLQAEALLVERRLPRVGHGDRLADDQRHRRERLRDLRAVPALQRPVPVRLDVIRQDRLPRRPREEHGARLDHARRAPRPVDGEGGRTPHREVPSQLHERARTASRRGAARRPEAEPVQDPRDPLAVEVLAGDDDDAAVTEVMEPRQDAPVPEREDRLPAAVDDGLVVLGAGDLPPVGPAEDREQRVSRERDQRRLDPLAGRERHIPSYWGPPPPSGGTQSMTW